MSVLDRETRLKLVNAGGEFLVAAEELVEKLSRCHRQAALVGHGEYVHEFLVGGSFHSPEHRARWWFA